MAVEHQEILALLPPGAPDFGPLEEVYPKNTVDRKPWFNFVLAGVLFAMALAVLVVRFVATVPDDEGERVAYQVMTIGFPAVCGLVGLIALIQGLVRFGRATSVI